MDREELKGTLAAAWKRQLVPYTDMEGVPLYGIYADEALTGFLAIADPPLIGEFRSEQCVLIPLALWIMMTMHARETVTNSVLVAVGKNIIFKFWPPATGMKYACRHTKHGHMIHIPISEFKDLK